VSVLLVTPHPGTVATSYMQSVLSCQAYDRSHDHHLRQLALIQCSAGNLPQVRNQGARLLLDSDAEWLWMVDSDMGFVPDTLERLIDCSVQVVGAMCFGLRSAGPDGMFGSVSERFATLYGEDLQSLDSWPENTLLSVHATGTGCLLVNRSVLEKIGTGWFDPVEGPDGYLSEDLSFCSRVRDAGEQVYVHTGVRTSHYKSAWI